MLNELTIESSNIKKINYRMYLVFIFSMSQIHPHIL